MSGRDIHVAVTERLWHAVTALTVTETVVQIVVIYNVVVRQWGLVVLEII